VSKDVATRVICANRTPDHTTIARFRPRHEAALAELFGDVLWLCADAGLVYVGIVAVDGTKVQAKASHHATRDYEQIAREILEHADAVDAEEDVRFGGARGDELPEPLSTSEGRQRWLRDARRRMDERRAREARPIPGPRPKRLKEANRRLEEDHQVQLDANAAYEDHRRNGRMRNGRRLGGHSPPKPYQPPDAPDGRINVSDLDSRNVKTPRGWVQGYNAQAVATADQIVIAAEVTIDSPDFGHLEPMVRAAQTDLHYSGVTDTLNVVLADAGYWHHVQMKRLMSDGMQVLIPPDANKRNGERPGWQGGLYALMRRVLASERGGELYARRQTMIEPVFALTKFNRRCDRFLRRGRSACRSEWRLINATHNLLKLCSTPSRPRRPEGPPAAVARPPSSPSQPDRHQVAPRRPPSCATASLERGGSRPACHKSNQSASDPGDAMHCRAEDASHRSLRRGRIAG
jgi:hypothetical protein